MPGGHLRVPELDPVEYLVKRKYPAVYHAIPVSLLSRPKSADELAYRAAQKEEMEAYRERLEAMSVNELNELVSEEKAREQAANQARLKQEEAERFYNQPWATADFDHWSKAAYWSHDEGIALIFGKEPKVVNWGKLESIVGISKFAYEYGRVRDLAIRSKAVKELPDPAIPGLFLGWARRMELNPPTELLEQVRKRGQPIGDFYDRYEELRDEANSLLEGNEKLAAANKTLQADNEQLAARLADLESKTWEFDEDAETYPRELDIAVQAWVAVSKAGGGSGTPKQRIADWLDKNYPTKEELSGDARKRIAILANWEKTGGRRKA